MLHFKVAVVFVHVISLTSSQRFEKKLLRGSHGRGMLDVSDTMVTLPQFSFKVYGLKAPPIAL